MTYDAKKVAGQKLVMGTETSRTIEQTTKDLNVILFRDIDGKFATTTNGAIIKKSNGEILLDDEPLFLFRARDNRALPLLQAYREACALDPESSGQVEKMTDIIQHFVDFKNEHPERMKQPGVTRGL